MKTVTKIQTLDGVLHDTPAEAKRHADQVYGLALSRIAHQLIHLNNKYSALMDYMDANIAEFTKLAALKDDLNHDNENNS